VTATVTQVRAALATVLAVDGLTVHAFRPQGITPPAAVVMPPPGDYLTKATIDGGYDLQLVVGLYVEWGDDQSATEQLDAFLTATGTSSLIAAIDANPTLGGVANSAWATAAADYGVYTWAEIPYYGGLLPVTVLL
jgi:hypothetical protein